MKSSYSPTILNLVLLSSLLWWKKSHSWKNKLSWCFLPFDASYMNRRDFRSRAFQWRGKLSECPMRHGFETSGTKIRGACIHQGYNRENHQLVPPITKYSRREPKCNIFPRSCDTGFHNFPNVVHQLFLLLSSLFEL